MQSRTDSEGDRAARWRREQDYFDEVARERSVALEPMHALTLERYGSWRRRRFSLEYRFRLLGSLAGKRVLDVGCGDGTNAVLLARLGATVTGIDVSEASIALANRRAEINSVSDRVTFICAPLEDSNLPQASFDVVFGDAILHHVIADLDDVLARCRSWVRPGGLVMFSEPVVFARWLRRLRLSTAIPVEGTPDERPLEPPEIERIMRALQPCETRVFALFSRLNRFLFAKANYEHSGPMRRMIAEAFALMDYWVLSIPGLRRLGGAMVFAGRPGNPSQ